MSRLFHQQTSPPNTFSDLLTIANNQVSIRWNLFPHFPNGYDSSSAEEEQFPTLYKCREVAIENANQPFRSVEDTIRQIHQACLRTHDTGYLSHEELESLITYLLNAARIHINALMFKTHVVDKMPPIMKGFCDEAAYLLIRAILDFQLRKRVIFPFHFFRFSDPTTQPPTGHVTVLLNLYHPPQRNSTDTVLTFLQKCQQENPRMQICDGWLKYNGPVNEWASRFQLTKFYGGNLSRYTKLELCNLALPTEHPYYPSKLNQFIGDHFTPLTTGYPAIPKSPPFSAAVTEFIIFLIIIVLGGSLYSLLNHFPTTSIHRPIP